MLLNYKRYDKDILYQLLSILAIILFSAIYLYFEPSYAMRCFVYLAVVIIILLSCFNICLSIRNRHRLKKSQNQFWKDNPDLRKMIDQSDFFEFNEDGDDLKDE